MFLTNKMFNPYFNWPLSSQDFAKMIKGKYGSVIRAKKLIHEYRQIIEEETATLPDNWMERLPPKNLWPQPNVPDRWPEEEKPQLFATGGRAGLQWGSDKGEGLGGEEVEADMRYEGGFMPYGEEPKADDVPARLSKDEFVFTDAAVAGAGEGDVNLGAERLYAVMKNLEQGGPLSQESQGETGQGIGELI